MHPTRLRHLTSRLQGFGTTIFAQMTALAQAHDAVNLGQGFPDFEGPPEIREAAIAAIEAGHNQYCRSAGIMPLVEAIADHQHRFYGLDVDPTTEVTVFHGATEAIASTLLALCEVGDEVLFFEPFYDSYRAVTALAGARERVIGLRSSSFDYDPAALEAAFSPRTRAVIVNSPHNPTGKVFSDQELAHIARLCVKNDVIAITDEVYEHLVFEGQHRPLASFEGMRDRTVTISSTGKTFSFTGWKIGYACASPELTQAIRCTHQFVTYCNGTPFQHAMALALRLPDSYYADFVVDYRARRDRLCAGLHEVGFGVHAPAGTYFVTVDIRPLGYSDGVAFCHALPKAAGVAAIPAAAFYLDQDAGRHLVRFAFCKSDAVLDRGITRLRDNLHNVPHPPRSV